MFGRRGFGRGGFRGGGGFGRRGWGPRGRGQGVNPMVAMGFMRLVQQIMQVQSWLVSLGLAGSNATPCSLFGLRCGGPPERL